MPAITPRAALLGNPPMPGYQPRKRDIADVLDQLQSIAAVEMLKDFHTASGDLPDSGNEVGDKRVVLASEEDGGGVYEWTGADWVLIGALPTIMTSDFYAELARAWAEGNEPGGTGTASAKTWAESALAIAETLGDLSELEALAQRSEDAEEGAIVARDEAETARAGAELAATSTGYQPGTAAAEAALVNGDVFWIIDGDEAVYYQIVSGSAVAIEGARVPLSGMFTTTAAANKAPRADGTGRIADGWLPPAVDYTADLFSTSPAPAKSPRANAFGTISTGWLPDASVVPPGTVLYQLASQEVPPGWLDLGPVASLLGSTAMRLIANQYDFWSVQLFVRAPMVLRDDTITAAAGGNANAQRGICWSLDGSRIYALSRGDSIIRQADVTEPWSVASGLTYSGATPFNAASGAAHGFAMRSDGLQCYIFQRTDVRAYDLTVPWDITTTVNSIVANVDVTGPGISRGHGISFSPDGRYMYLDCRRNTPEDDPAAIYQFELLTPWDISTLIFVGKYEIPLNIHTAQRGNQLSADGTRLFILNVGSRVIWEYKLYTPWMVATARPAAALDFGTVTGVTSGISPYGFAFVANGRSFIFSEENGRISQVATPARTRDHGSLSTQMVWEYDTSLGSGTTVSIGLREPRAADFHVIDWGDANVETLLPGSGSGQVYTHEYAEDGVYQVTLTGGSGGIILANDAVTRSMLTRVLDWGDGMGWRSFQDVARDCPNLVDVAANWPASVHLTGTATTGTSGLGAFMNSPIGAIPAIAEWDLGGLIDARGMFRNIGAVNFPVRWTFGGARAMQNFLLGTPFNQRLDDIDMNQVTDLRSFLFNSGFDNDSPKNWDWRSVTFASGVFPTLSTANYDAILIGIAAWGADLQSDVAFGAASSKYSPAAADARDYLVTTKNWTITDGGPE